jgi:hypothetical protein
MTLLWRKHQELADIALPQKVMRQFWHPKANTLDDEQYCTNLPNELPLLVASIVLLAALSSLSIAVYLASLNVHIIYAQITWTNELIVMFTAIFSLIAISVVLLVYFTRIIRARHMCINRKTRSTTVPGPTLIPTHYSDNYNNFQGMILHEKNLFGRRRARLVLQHLPSGQIISLYTTYDTPQTLAGYWSFIVQYMKPGAQLPDVPALHHYPNTTPGVRPHPTIDYS